jgi:hypothetical protein
VAGVEIEAFEELAAREAIRQQLHNYCRAMDRRDDQLGYGVWHDDGTADYGPGIFQGRGRDFVDQVSRNHLRRLAHSHQIATVGYRGRRRSGRQRGVRHPASRVRGGRRLQLDRPVPGHLPGGGSRDTADPSYELFRDLRG